jgi:transglutaminase-like putative cysteine protease
VKANVAAPRGTVARARYLVPPATFPATGRQRDAGTVNGRVLLEVAAEAFAASTSTGMVRPPAPPSEDPAVAELAVRLASALAPRARLEAFARWIAEHVAAGAIAGTASAAATIAARRGDCSERAELFAALCRSAGLPARRVTGLLWYGDAFHGHAWCEVWLDRWVEIDPSTGLPVDARFLLLWRTPATGNALALLSGAIEVVSATPAANASN